MKTEREVREMIRHLGDACRGMTGERDGGERALTLCEIGILLWVVGEGDADGKYDTFLRSCRNIEAELN